MTSRIVHTVALNMLKIMHLLFAFLSKCVGPTSASRAGRGAKALIIDMIVLSRMMVPMRTNMVHMQKRSMDTEAAVVTLAFSTDMPMLVRAFLTRREFAVNFEIGIALVLIERALTYASTTWAG